MATVAAPVAELERPETVADLLQRLGGIPPERVRLRPVPGTATVEDVITAASSEKRLFELVDGTLVEKVMGYPESVLATFLIAALDSFVRPKNRGLVTGEAGMMRLFGGLVRIPDVAFASWNRIPGGRIPAEAVPELVPDLAVEIISPGNTRAEMRRKRLEYFQAGVRLVWEVDPPSRTVAVYTGPDACHVLTGDEILDGGDALPGFELSLRGFFAELDRVAGRGEA